MLDSNFLKPIFLIRFWYTIQNNSNEYLPSSKVIPSKQLKANNNLHEGKKNTFNFPLMFIILLIIYKLDDATWWYTEIRYITRIYLLYLSKTVTSNI